MRPLLSEVPPLSFPLTAPGQRDFREAVNRVVNSLNRALFANLAPDGDAQGKDGIQTVFFPAANTDLVLPHTLGRLPRGVLTLNVDVDGAVIRADTAKWTTTYIVLRSSAANVTALLVVV